MTVSLQNHDNIVVVKIIFVKSPVVLHSTYSITENFPPLVLPKKIELKIEALCGLCIIFTIGEN